MKKTVMIFAVCLMLLGLLAVNDTLAQNVQQIFQTITGVLNGTPQQDEQLLQVELVYQVRNAQGNSLVTEHAQQILFPAAYSNDYAWAKVETSVGEATYSLWDGNQLNGAVDKFVSVKNTGTSQDAKDAYFRIAFAVNASIFDKLKLNWNTSPDFIWENSWQNISINGRAFKMMVATYTKALKAGEISPSTLLQIAMDKSATNADYAAMGTDFLQIKVMAVDADTLTGTESDAVRPGAVETLDVTVPLTSGFNPF